MSDPISDQPSEVEKNSNSDHSPDAKPHASTPPLKDHISPNSTVPLPSESPPRKIRRLGIGINVAIQIVLALVLFLGANYLSFRHYQRWDLTLAKDYTLAESSKNLIKDLEKEIKILVIFPSGSKVTDNVRSLVEEYRREGGGKVHLEYLDPARNPDRAEKVKIDYNLKLDKNLVLVSFNDEPKGAKIISEEEMVILDPQRVREERMLYFRGEDAISSAILSLVEGRPRILHYLVGHGGRAEENDPGFRQLQFLGLKQNIHVLPLNLALQGSLPTDSEGLILAGPRNDLTVQELEILTQLMENPRGALFILRNPDSLTPKLDEWLEEYGIRPRHDRVLYAENTTAGPQVQFMVQAAFVPNTRLTQNLGNGTATLPGQSSSLELPHSPQELELRSLRAEPLLLGDQRFWGETNFSQPLPVPDRFDALPPVTLAVSVERGYSRDEGDRSESSRMVVVANSELINPLESYATTHDLISASFNWMLNREQMIGIQTKEKRLYRIDLSKQNFKILGMNLDGHEILMLILVGLLPATVLSVAFVVWSIRRA